MTLRKAALAVIVIALMAGACGGGGDGGWERFVSEDGEYSFLVPSLSLVEVESETTETSFGELDFTRYVVEFNRKLFVSLYSDLAPENLAAYTADELVSFAAETLAEDTSGTLLSNEPISLGGAPGREVRVELETGRVFIMRVFQVGGRQFQIGSISSREEQSSSDVLRFLDSLRIE